MRRAGGRDDGGAAPPRLLWIDSKAFRRLATIVADTQYYQHALHTWMNEHLPLWCLVIKTHPEGGKEFTPVEIRGVVEWTNA